MDWFQIKAGLGWPRNIVSTIWTAYINEGDRNNKGRMDSENNSRSAVPLQGNSKPHVKPAPLGPCTNPSTWPCINLHT